MKYLDLHLKENLIRQTSFLQKKPSQKPASFSVKGQIKSEFFSWYFGKLMISYIHSDLIYVSQRKRGKKKHMPGYSGSFFLWLSFSHSQAVIKIHLVLLKMMKISLEWHHFSLNLHFEWKKLWFDYFLMTTWEGENKCQREKTENPDHSCLKAVCNELNLDH